MKKTTVYLPGPLKKSLERLAESSGRSEAEIIRDAVATAVEKAVPPKPRLPLFPKGTFPSDMAERIDDYLEGFGED